MIFLRIKLDNIFMFKGAELDLTYPRKLKNSTIDCEWLEEFPNIKYKKVCILSGANASGKTVFGKALCMINNYLLGRDINQDADWLNLRKMMFNKNKRASFEVEFITPGDKKCHLLKASFDDDGLFEELYRYVDLDKSESQAMLAKRLRGSRKKSWYNRIKKSHDIKNAGFSSVAFSLGVLKVIAGWNYQFCQKENINESPIKPKNTKVIKMFLSAFDNSIKEVETIELDSYKIKFSNKEYVLVDKGVLVNPDRLSRGTHEALEIAMFFELMKNHKDSDILGTTYYLDEKLAYSHTEAEKSILTLLIACLPKQSQLFYTTHNYDILDMNLPAHSYVFLRKDKFSEFVQPEKLGFNKNDRSLLGYVKNDVFGSLPNLDAIDNLV